MLQSGQTRNNRCFKAYCKHNVLKNKSILWLTQKHTTLIKKGCSIICVLSIVAIVFLKDYLSVTASVRECLWPNLLESLPNLSKIPAVMRQFLGKVLFTLIFSYPNSRFRTQTLKFPPSSCWFLHPHWLLSLFHFCFKLHFTTSNSDLHLHI